MSSLILAGIIIFLLLVIGVITINVGGIETEEVIECPECNCPNETERIKSSMEIEAEEIVAEVNEYYYYNKSNQHNFLTADELKRLGGVCWHYGEHMRKLAQDRGYVAVSEEINLMQSGRHQNTKMSGGAGYCILDSFEDRGAFVVGCSP